MFLYLNVSSVLIHQVEFESQKQTYNIDKIYYYYYYYYYYDTDIGKILMIAIARIYVLLLPINK